jgi:penicillin-binding protein 1A
VIHEFLSNPAFGKTRKKRAKLLFQGGVRVHTTLEPSLQRRAEAVLEQRMSGPGMPQSALVAIDPNTGEIRTMAVGNAPWGERHQYNLAVDPGGGRTAGSAFKAFTVVAALEAGVSPNKVYDGSSPKTIPGCGGGENWTLQNAEPGSGRYPLWNATAHSVNTVFAQVIDEVGPEHVADVAERMGITNHMVPVCPLTLGTSPVSPLQMTSGYATLANRGVRCRPTAITKVVDTDGRVIFHAEPHCERVVEASIADEATAMLQKVIESGTGTAANIGRPAAGKTGTGQNYQDAWFLGYTPQLATGVWVGYARGEIPMPSVPGYGRGYGGVLAAPIWHDFMLYAMHDQPIMGFPPPPIPFQSYSPPAPSPSSGPDDPSTGSGQDEGGDGGGGPNGQGPGGEGPPGQDG